MEYLLQLFNETIDNFEKMLQAGQIDEDEYNQLLTSAYLELQERMADELGIEEEDVEELVAANYAADDDIAEFSVGSRFGAALLELGEEAGYEDIEDYCEELAEATGNAPEDIFALIQGQIAPSDELSVAIAEVFGLNENVALDLVAAGFEARGEDINDYLEDEEDDDEYEENEYEDDDSDDEQYHAVREELAEFKLQSAIKDELAEIVLQASELVDAGKMLPAVAETLIGSFSLDSDRIAAFSTVCDRNGVDAATELYAMKKTLEIFERMPAIEFGYYANEVLTEEEVNEEQDLSVIAANYVKNLRKN